MPVLVLGLALGPIGFGVRVQGVSGVGNGVEGIMQSMAFVCFCAVFPKSYQSRHGQSSYEPRNLTKQSKTVE